MNINVNNVKIADFKDLPLGTFFKKKEGSYLYLRIKKFTNFKDKKDYNAINLTTMDYDFFYLYDKVVFYKEQITLE